jgi:glycosyltransferase involved in cell wall biosynthesis
MPYAIDAGHRAGERAEVSDAARQSRPEPKPPIRVLLIAPSLDILGGQAVQASRLLELFASDPRLIVTHLPVNPRLPRLLRPATRVPYLRTVINFVVFLIGLIRDLPRHDVVHVFTPAYTSFLFWTTPATVLSKAAGKRVIINYRDGQAEDHLQHWRTAVPVLRLADAIVTPSGFLVDVFARFGLRAESIFNVIDRRRFIDRRRGTLRPHLLHNRILEPLYNVECTLRAFRLIQDRYPDARLTIAHDGPLRDKLEQLARELNLRHTEFVGKVSQQDMPALYDRADVYVTSPDIDCMPGSLLECFASGLPVVATDAGGISYIAEHERTALLVPRGDHREMADAAIRLIEDSSLVERLTANAREEVLRYDGHAVRDAWCRLYARLLARLPQDAESPALASR